MGDSNNSSGLIGLAVAAVVALLAWKIVPGLFKIASAVIVIGLIVFAVLIVVMVIYAIRTPVKKQRGGVEENGTGAVSHGDGSEKSGSSTDGTAAVDRGGADGSAAEDASGTDAPDELKTAKKYLLDIMNENIKIRDTEVRALSSEVSKSAEKIINTLADQPEDIRKCRQFYNYYLPTYLQIMRKYRKLETSGLEIGDVRTELLSYMKRIGEALDKQYEVLFDNDKFDLSVEMEALDQSLKRSGLLVSDTINKSVSDTLTKN